MEKLKEAFNRARELSEQGDYHGALEVFVWLHDNPVPGRPESEMFRRAYGFQAWGYLARIYAPAKEKMQEVLDKNISLAEREIASKDLESDIRVMTQILASVNAPESE